GGGARAGARLDQVTQGVDREADVAVVVLGGGRSDHQHDLPLDVAAEAPRATSSCIFVSSRQTAAGRSGAIAASAANDSPTRRGDSKATTVSAERSTRSISPERFGRKPSKRQRSVGRPEATSATGTTEGPGRTTTSRSRSMQRRIKIGR